MFSKMVNKIVELPLPNYITPACHGNSIKFAIPVNPTSTVSFLDQLENGSNLPPIPVIALLIPSRLY